MTKFVIPVHVAPSVPPLLFFESVTFSIQHAVFNLHAVFYFTLLHFSSSWTIDGALRDGKKTDPKFREESLTLELLRIKEENKKTLEELRILEDQQLQQKKDIEAAQFAEVSK